MLDALRPFFSRLIAPAITALLAILATKFGIDFGADAAQHLTAYATVIAFAVFTAVNGVFHRVIDKKVNPGDAASSHLAGAEKTESKQLKAGGE
ncbi:MAG TPA: hypothetical protein VNJ04_02550 [Gemmatimonadaceae bacterium]|nr:hypothetical protein [Gemmatimonadaceae bacterium]